jgi:hypothetical protein
MPRNDVLLLPKPPIPRYRPAGSDEHISPFDEHAHGSNDGSTSTARLIERSVELLA